jgi:hypothetical protein
MRRSGPALRRRCDAVRNLLVRNCRVVLPTGCPSPRPSSRFVHAPYIVSDSSGPLQAAVRKAAWSSSGSSRRAPTPLPGRTPALRSRSVRRLGRRPTSARRDGLGAVRSGRPQLHRLRTGADGTHADRRAARATSRPLSPVCANVPAPAGMVVNRPTGGAPLRVNQRREADTTARP